MQHDATTNRQEGRNERRRRDERGREGQEARKCDATRQPNKWRGVKRAGAPTERRREATEQHDNQLVAVAVAVHSRSRSRSRS